MVVNVPHEERKVLLLLLRFYTLSGREGIIAHVMAPTFACADVAPIACAIIEHVIVKSLVSI